MKRKLTKVSSILLSMCILLSVGQIQKIDATNNTKSEVVLIDESEIRVSVRVETNDHERIWSLHYNKIVESNTALIIGAFSDASELQFIPHEDWGEFNEGHIKEAIYGPSNGVVEFIGDLDQENIEIKIGRSSEGEETSASYQSFAIDIRDFKVVDDFEDPEKEQIIDDAQLGSDETSDNTQNNDSRQDENDKDFENEKSEELEIREGEDGETIFVVDNLDKLIQVQELILKAANNKADNYPDPFEYLTDDSGVYPRHKSQEFNVGLNSNTTLNYDHAVNSTIPNEPDSANSYGLNRNFLSGYHSYSNGIGDDVLTKKTVKPTNIPNQFEIELDIIGGTMPQTNPVDVVLIMDKSGSMNSNLDGGTATEKNKSRWTLLKVAVEKLAIGLLTEDNDVRMGMTSFGSTHKNSSNNYETIDLWTDIAKFNDNEYFTSSAKDIVESPLYKEAINTSGTPTFMGIESGMKVMRNSKPEAEKFLILLTDGVSTYSPTTKFPGIENITSKKENNKEKYTLTDSSMYSGTGVETDVTGHTNKNIEHINTLVKNNQVSNLNYMSLGIGEQNPNSQDSMNKLLKAFSGDLTFDGTTPEGINEAFEKIKTEITKDVPSFSNGVLLDPMSEYVTIVPNSFNTSSLRLTQSGIDEIQVINKDGSINALAPKYARDVVVDRLPNANNDEIGLSSISLGSDGNARLGYRINYTVELNSNNMDGMFYPTNGPTRAADRNSEGALGFAVPSVRVPRDSFEFIKVGEDGLVLEGAVFELTRSGILIDTITSDENGIIKLSNLNFGDYVLKEIEAPLGYDLMEEIEFSIEQGPPVHNGVLKIRGLDSLKDSQGSIVLQNKLKDFELKVRKLDNFGNAVKDVRFKLEGPNYIQEISGSGVNGNEFDFLNLRPGTYILSEVSNPDNYVKMEDVIIEISKDGSVRIDGNEIDDVISLEGNIIFFEAINIMKGKLPSTGSNAMMGFRLLSTTFLVLSLLVGAYGLYRQRRYR